MDSIIIDTQGQCVNAVSAYFEFIPLMMAHPHIVIQYLLHTLYTFSYLITFFAVSASTEHVRANGQHIIPHTYTHTHLT